MTKTELRDYRILSAEVRQIQKRLEALEASMQSPSGQRYTRTPRGPEDAGRTTEALVDAHMRLVSLYQSKLLSLNREMLRIEAAISGLRDPQERMLLRCRYLDGLDWPRVCQELHYSESQVHRIHGRALQNLLRGCPPVSDSRSCSGLLDE